MPISIIIPTYTAKDYLALCLESIYLNQKNKNNEVVVVIDGTYDLNKDIIKEYKTKLNLKEVIFEENVGLATATNYGFYNASNNLCLNINDDNVCPEYFDQILIEDYLSLEYLGKNLCIVPNQIEPKPSIFKPFIIRNFGETTEEFDLNKFTLEEKKLRPINGVGNLGWTLPFFIKRNVFIASGGFDVNYNSGHVIDWDFFVKLELLEIINRRTFKCNFYHFGSKSSRTPESYQKEIDAHKYFEYKWGFKSYNRLLL